MKTDLQRQVTLLAANDPIIKSLQAEIERLQANLARLEREKQQSRGELRSDMLTRFWYSIVTSAARAFVPEVFTRARIQAPLSILPPPAPPSQPLGSKSKDKKAIAAKAQEAKNRDLAKEILSLFKSKEQAEDIISTGDKIEIKVVNNELEVMLPTELLSQEMILNIMVKKFVENQEAKKQGLRELSVLEVVTTLEKNKMISAINREDKPVNLILQEAIEQLKAHAQTLPEISKESVEEAHQSLSVSNCEIVEKANARKARRPEQTKEKVAEAVVVQPDPLGFNNLSDVLKEIQTRSELLKKDPGYFTKANFSQVRTKMADGLRNFRDQSVEIDRKAKEKSEKRVTRYCELELKKLREKAAKVGSILIENKPEPIASVVSEVTAEQSVAPAAVIEDTQPAPAAQVVVPDTVQQGLLDRIFGRGNNTVAITK